MMGWQCHQLYFKQTICTSVFPCKMIFLVHNEQSKITEGKLMKYVIFIAR